MTSVLRNSAGGLDDGALARAAADGDRAAFAAIYDRYADRLHDFCIGMLRDRDAAADCVQDVFVTAATRLVQLREPDRLRSWLYAIARNEALARIRDRKREQPSEELPEMPSGEADLATLASRNELAQLIADASGGLTDRDRAVLELAYRQGLDGPELAEALGVTARNANTLVERLRDTIARSLGALLVCRRAAADPDKCPELTAILADWDGEFTVLMRKRVARHIDGCPICEEDRARMVSPAMLLGAMPMLIPAPKWLREQTLSKVQLGGPAPSAPPPGTGQSWWPENDFDVSDLAVPSASAGAHAAPRGRAARIGLGAALVLLAIGGAAVVRAPANFKTVPAVSPGTTTSTTTSAIITTTTPTTTPSAIPRLAPSEPAPIPPPVQSAPSTIEETTAATTAHAPNATTRTTTASTEEPTTTRPTKTTQPKTTEPPTSEPPPAQITSDPPTAKPTPKPTVPTKQTIKPQQPDKQDSKPVCPGDPECPPVFT